MAASVPSASWLILGARFHAVVVDRLVEGARTCLLQKGVPASHLGIERVAGAFELPQLAAAWASRPLADRPAGIVALGCVVRGETPHFDFVCAEASRGLMDVALRSGVALGFGLLTCDTLQQALDRAGGPKGDKGWDAAEAAWDLAARMADAHERPEQAGS
jgi:6,7-dimethyl-8-ribityllumazine synthase